MSWIIPALLFITAMVFWRLSFHTDDHLVAWVRFFTALLLICIALIYSLVLLVGWALA
ncbi:hypothetical protein [Bowmanella yangjiangensis]|uniref:Uncharacterized protein n=1 Tax=Bowmanella yangjiangensis TaxID=2811230 RepID=A0ABS3CYI0_9ALTE|nr:hypothetical protein [Bowmanella yangjiangensis]MBN7822182.1 hypothetical protein [Bowmanella yangjiangensis]